MRIGIDLGGTKIEAVALADDGRELLRRRVATPRDDYDGTVAAVAALSLDLERELGESATVGVGIPGAISPATGLVKNANSTWLIGRPFDRDLERALARPVRVENDANCFAVSEATDGAGRDGRVVFGVILGTGCGGGVVVDKRALTGRHAIAGEWGHNPLPWPRDDERPGPLCYCQKRGCIETFVSGPGIARDHEERTGERSSAAELDERAAAGDAAAVETLALLEDRLARALATVVNVLDPDVIVLGGGVSNIARLYESVPRLLSRYAFSDVISVPVVRATHGDSSGVRGAAWLWPNAQG